METIRTFIAIELDEAMRRQMAEAQETLRRGGSMPVRWVRPDGAHITLKFLGSIEAEMVPRVAAAVAQAAEAARPFIMGFGPVGGFPSLRDARVIWYGLTGDIEALRSLRDDVERLVSPLGFPTEARPFKPHLTLARLQDGAKAVDLRASGAGTDALRESLSQKITEVVLFRSDLSRHGPVYTPISRFSLKG